MSLKPKPVTVFGVPTDVGAGTRGASMGPEALRVADWVATSHDNHALPYAVIDKNNAALILFDAKGKMVTQVSVLIALQPGRLCTAAK